MERFICIEESLHNAQPRANTIQEATSIRNHSIGLKSAAARKAKSKIPKTNQNEENEIPFLGVRVANEVVTLHPHIVVNPDRLGYILSILYVPGSWKVRSQANAKAT